MTYYQDKFHYIHVDEYQDTNDAQYELVHMLAEKYENICVVGMPTSQFTAGGGQHEQHLKL